MARVRVRVCGGVVSKVKVDVGGKAAATGRSPRVDPGTSATCDSSFNVTPYMHL